MARNHGKDGRLYVGIASSTAAAEPIAFLTNWTLDASVEQVETTAFEDTTKTYKTGKPDSTGTYSGFFDDTTAQLYTAATDGDARRWYLYPDATVGTAGPYWFGTGHFDFSVSGAVDGAVQCSGNWFAATSTSKIGG